MRRNTVVIAAIFLVLSYVCFGHAILLSAKPVGGESVAGPDVPISLQFNSRVDTKRSKMTLVLPGGEAQTLEIDAKSSPDSLNSQARGLKTGTYVLQWQVLAVDGHISRGEVKFQVQ